ncbi:hypothetical protein E2562_034689 [Oryza meyeriana var. granulata]|uniref:Uncharacterized protein n=1 Tax=Oryza meyeriana var. granulata TaxID=110450 RepID=A0A6G1C283_9ORYZ|nr:hypothetical protein E2562_034689 [Oryza meyeriana var. granulata]
MKNLVAAWSELVSSTSASPRWKTQHNLPVVAFPFNLDQLSPFINLLPFLRLVFPDLTPVGSSVAMAFAVGSEDKL